MPFNAPFKLGPFSVDPEGRLTPCDPPASPAFLFRWHDRVVHCRVAQAEAMTGRLFLQTTLARIPSTAGASDETRRPRSFTLLHWLTRSLPADWQISLLANHRVWLETDARIELPITAAALLTRITSFVLELAPFVDLLDEMGLTLPTSDSA